ncbi:PepSY domain-containing protein [Chitinophaga agrisoli]|uniref:PepSY domain-containing protein n=1 Tax=Chitinophaga agrisoli TaxID=2607653 RepID=A0A5B2VU43_9BACT|nr:PepSY-associated TM helix domain-containing protein [Chitinophaga agrisoli]KAA2241756.1 PepSY domain-containing protein [Chitinophaga agrisoli]
MTTKHRNLKYWIGKVHLWLGLSAGLIVVFLGITGCILAFQREIETVTLSYRYIQNEQKPLLPPSALKEIAMKALPGKAPHSVTFFKKDRAVEVAFYAAEPEYYYVAYINPYTGQVLKLKNMDQDFFRVVLMGHYYLWLPPAIGQPIMASATLVFLVMLITGIVLWWPKNRAASKQRFSIKWNARWRRINYDLHNVLGFYATWVVIFIVLTGLVMGFQWFAQTVYWTSSGGKTLTEYYEPVSNTAANIAPARMPATDQIWEKMKAAYPNAGLIEVHYPENDSASIGAVANPDIETYWQQSILFFDQYTLKEIPVTHSYGRFEAATGADKLARMNYDMHIGALLGLPGKIMAFCGSLIAASLPITGFYVWWGRRHKKHPAKAVKGARVAMA